MTTAVQSPFKSDNTASNKCGVTLMNNQVGEIRQDLIKQGILTSTGTF